MNEQNILKENRKVAEIEKMWSAFADIPIHSEDETEVDFMVGKTCAAGERIVLTFGRGLMKSYPMDWQWILIWYNRHYGITHKHR